MTALDSPVRACVWSYFDYDAMRGVTREGTLF
jgi:hypothetical protein